MDNSSQADDSAGSFDAAFTLSTFFGFILKIFVLILSVGAELLAAYALCFLYQFDKSKGGFQGPPASDNWLGVAIGLVVLYVLLLIFIGATMTDTYHAEFDIYRDIAVSLPMSLGLAFATVGMYHTFQALYTTIIGPLHSLTRTLTTRSRRHYGFTDVELERTEQSNPTETQEGGEESLPLMDVINDKSEQTHEAE